jgi:hypothetical protein
VGQLFNALIEFFEEDEWDFNWVEGQTVLSMGFAGRNGRWMCYAQAREPQEQFVFYSVCPMNAPDARRAAVAEFITRANYGMILGNFELDYSDGEVRYKTSTDVEGAQLAAATIKQLVYTNVLIMDRYLPGIMAVMFGGANPADEVARIEAVLALSDTPPDDVGLDDEDEDDDTPDVGTSVNGAG